MMLDKQKIQVIFLSSKWVVKQQRNLSILTMHLAQELLMAIQVFCKRDESLEDEKCNGQSSEVDNDQLRAIIKSDPLTTTSCQKTQC